MTGFGWAGPMRVARLLTGPGIAGYRDEVAITPDYRQLHQAVDRLSPVQAEALYVVVEAMLGEGSPAGPVGSATDEAPRSGHRLSFTAAGSGPADLAERAEEYLRAGGFGDAAG